MKFLTRINRNFIILFALILAGVSVSGFFILHAVLLRNTKENLLSKEYLIIKQIASTGEIPTLHPVIEIQKTHDTLLSKPLYSYTEFWNESEKENEVFIEYSNTVRIADNYYNIKLRQSTFENEDLVLILAFTLFVLLCSAFLISFLITKKLNKTVWADFEHNLHTIESFSLTDNKSIVLLNSGIDEFERLNKAVDTLTEKLKTDYLSLKEFTENASHEIQTPLTIALLNLEEVLQQDLSPDSLSKTVTAISAIKRLSSLNQSLILLTKIENRQFNSDEMINISDTLKYYLNEFSSLFESMNLTIDVSISGNLYQHINRQLAGILISNLLSNAVNHNMLDGLISISVSESELKICNTGPGNEFNNGNIFDRFVKGPSKSYGLGLALVKKICDTHNLQIQYSKNELHCFTLSSNS